MTRVARTLLSASWVPAMDKAVAAALRALLGLAPVALVVALVIYFSHAKRSARNLHPREEADILEFYPVPVMDFLVKLVLVLLAAFTGLTAVVALSKAAPSWRY